MGLIGTVLEFVRTLVQGRHVAETKFDPGGEPNLTAEHFAPPGDDAHPLRDDKLFAAQAPGSGAYAVVGYIDTRNAGTAGPGEKRLYARDDDGNVVGVLYLTSGGPIRAGADDADKPVPTAERVDEEFARLWDLLSGWTVSPMDGGAALKSAATAQKPAVQTVASKRLFVDK